MKTTKTISMQQFAAEVKKLAKGKFHNVECQLTEFQTGKQEILFRCYIDGYEHTKQCRTPKDSLEEMKQQISHTRVEPEDVSVLLEVSDNDELPC